MRSRIFYYSGRAAGLVLMLVFCGYHLGNSVRPVHRFEGIVGMTKKNGFGCFCHGEDPTLSAHVWIEGPATIHAGEEAIYTLFLERDSTVTGGLDIATQFGILGVEESLYTYWYEDEITHVMPKPANGTDTVSWRFRYRTPALMSALVDTIFSAANSTNQDTMATEDDKWNFGENFLVTVLGPTDVGSSPGNPLPAVASLHQNYPNPFNPSTTIRFDLAEQSLVALDLFDISGRHVATLAEGPYEAGKYEQQLDAGRYELASGMYLCRFSAIPVSTGAATVITRKMVLLR